MRRPMDIPDKVNREYRAARDLLSTTTPDAADYTEVLQRYAAAWRAIRQRQDRDRASHGRYARLG